MIPKQPPNLLPSIHMDSKYYGAHYDCPHCDYKSSYLPSLTVHMNSKHYEIRLEHPTWQRGHCAVWVRQKNVHLSNFMWTQNMWGKSMVVTRSSWLNCALRDDEAVYCVSIWHYETVAVVNWWYWVSGGHLCLYILHKVEIWTGVTDALRTDWLTSFER